MNTITQKRKAIQSYRVKRITPGQHPSPKIWVESLEDRRLLSAVVPLGSEFRVNTYTSWYQYSPAVATNNSGNSVIAWASYFQDGSGYGIYAQRYNASGVAQGAEFRVNTYTTGDQGPTSDVPGFPTPPVVAMDLTGNFVIAWMSNGQDGSSTGIYAQRFNASGVPQGDEFRVNTHTAGVQASPDVGMDASGNFIITWRSDGQDGSGFGVYAQRYNASGLALGDEFRVNTYTSGTQDEPAVAVDGAGNFVVVWESYEQVGPEALYGQRYAASGAPLGGEFRVSADMHNQWVPSIACDATGNFVVAWTSDDAGIHAQRFSSSGLPQGGQYQVNSVNAGDFNWLGGVAMNSTGSFVVTWWGNHQTSSGIDVYAQCYDASGVAQGGEFRVNTFTSGDQMRPTVAVDGIGKFVIVWDSYGQPDGADVYSQPDIYAQRFGQPVGPISVSNGVLTITGTTGNDTYHVSSGGPGMINVFDRWGYVGVYQATKVIMYGGPGDDILDAAPDLTAPIEAHGGPGNDLLRGGAGNDSLFGEAGNDGLDSRGGNDILVGGDGNDIAFAGVGNDLLIGGLGSDSLYGEAGDDVLISGKTNLDDNASALQGAIGSWNVQSDYDTRAQAMRLTFLSSIQDNANDVDWLWGGTYGIPDRDYFMSSSLRTLFADRLSNERIN